MIESPLLPHLSGYINGRWTGPKPGKPLRVVNPATGEHLADVAEMGAAETVAAVEAAAAALRDACSLETRQQWLRQIVDLLMENKSELARIITLEQGKPLKESITEIEYSTGFFRFYSEALARISSEPLPRPIKNMTWTIHHRPAGVVGLITPWNFPLAMLAKKLAPALGAGCAIVAKPAELTPLTAIAFWTLVDRLNLPPGRLNLVIGSPEPIGDVLCSHPLVRVISFTGSTEVGKILIEKTAPHIKRLALELGGNAPFIVMKDADINVAADALMMNKFRCAGQTCVCANRIYVDQSIAEPFTRAVAERVKKLNVGNGLEPGTDIGPLISRSAVEKVQRHVDDALKQGAQRVVVAGDGLQRATGTFYPPTVLAGVNERMRVAQEETFGPVVPISTFDTEERAVQLANGTQHGLAAYLFTWDRDRAERMAAQLHFGHVGVNTGQGPTPEAPFGGMKQSGFGREGGLEGLLEFCETQTVVSA